MHSLKSANPISNASSAGRERLKLTLRRFAGDSAGARNARCVWRRRSGLLVDLCAGAAHGLGEASPLPGYSPDTLLDAEAALAVIDLRALERALELPDILAALKAVADLLPSTQPAARMALETAALDWRAHRNGVSAAVLLGAAPRAERALAWLVAASDFGAVRSAEAAGYRHFKHKIGAPGDLAGEVAAIKALACSLAVDSRLRLDANQSWTEVQAQYACRELESTDVEFIEEPCRGLSHPLETDIAVALDESLLGRRPDELEGIARRTGATIVVLKPMLQGGLTRCLELGQCAAALGLGVVVSHSFDGPVALTAAGALALTLPTTHAQGLAPHAGLGVWPAVGLPIAGAALQTWTRPGLGIAPQDLR
jgi:o-succinylbenzoate synthase